MKKMNDKIFAIATVGAITASIFGSAAYYSAYLTDQEQVTNSITYGSVETELEEPGWPGNDTAATTNIFPNQEIVKDPQVENVGNNSAITFLVMEVPVETVTMVKDDGTKQATKAQELFYFKDSEDAAGKHENNFDSGWMELESKETNNGSSQTAGTRTYVFAYKTKLAPGTKTTSLFDKIQIKNIIEGEVVNTKTIHIKNYSIQDSYILDTTGQDLTTDLSLSNLEKIYDTFVNQSGEDTARDASLGKKDLAGQNN